jgi:cell volume regulation protein A
MLVSVPDAQLYFDIGFVVVLVSLLVQGWTIAPEDTSTTLADFIAARTLRKPRAGDIVPIGPIALVVDRVSEGRIVQVGLRLAEELEPEIPPATRIERLKRALRRVWSRLGS